MREGCPERNNHGKEHAEGDEQPGIPGKGQQEDEHDKPTGRKQGQGKPPEDDTDEHQEHSQHNQATEMIGKTEPLVSYLCLTNGMIERDGADEGKLREGSGSPDAEILRCAQDDRQDTDCFSGNAC